MEEVEKLKLEIAKLRKQIRQLEDEVKKLGILKTKDKRAHPRKKVLTLVDYATSGKSYSGYVYNISEGGMFIRTRRPLAVETDTTLSLIMPESGVHIKVKGEVMWIGQDGMGLEFREVDKSTEGKIRSILSEM